MVPLAIVSVIGWWLALQCWSASGRLTGDPRQAVRITSRLRILAVFVGILPLLGLLGTVTGMIDTFGIIRSDGLGDPKLLAGGIREALIATESGLAAALPLLIFHQAVHARLRHAELEREARGGADA